MEKENEIKISFEYLLAVATPLVARRMKRSKKLVPGSQPPCPILSMELLFRWRNSVITCNCAVDCSHSNFQQDMAGVIRDSLLSMLKS